MNNRSLYPLIVALALSLGCVGFVQAQLPVQSPQQSPAVALVNEGVAHRQQGNLALSISSLRLARDMAPYQSERMLATSELGASLLQSRQLASAEDALLQAYDFFQGPDRARVALDLGNLAALQGNRGAAQRYYDEALQLGAFDARIRFSARLNRARLMGPDARLAEFVTLAQSLAQAPGSPDSARWQLNLGQQARLLGDSGLALAFDNLERARQWASGQGNQRLLAEALDALAQLYEDQQRTAESFTLNQKGLASAAGLPASASGELLVQLEWRGARLARALNRPAVALAAYRRAVQHIELLRQDMPIEDDTGGSSFRATLEPVYLGLVESLLQAADSEAAALPKASAERTNYLREAIATLELIRQSELQDYLGDRCDVDAVKGGTATVIPAGTAVLYPVMLADRLELLLETATGITRQSAAVGAAALREKAMDFADQTRNGTPGFMATARQLYDWVLRPLEPVLTAQNIDTLVAVPDGALRLVALGAFHDGQRFAIEKLAMATVTGMSMTNTGAPSGGTKGFLVAGISSPGPVVDRLNSDTVTRLLAPPPVRTAGTFGQGRAEVQEQFAALVTGRSVRSLGGGSTASLTAAGAATTVPEMAADSGSRTRALREALALPGVERELEAISLIAPGRRMLNAPFTVEGFRRAASSGDYSIIHIASHGVFGGTADASYIMAYDDLLTLDGLQTLLRSDAFRRHPVELLSLSACETAEGDERSPLGISGAAIKARAKAVMGSLWPVADEAAVPLMAQFYSGLAREGLSKAQALQRSQVALLRSPGYAHPFFWAPFILIGNWL